MVVIQKLQDFPQRENMYIENAYRKNESEVRLRDTGMVVDLTTMKIYPENQPTKQENVVRKEKFKGQSAILDAIAMVDIYYKWTVSLLIIFFCNSIAWVCLHIEYCFHAGSKIELPANWVPMKDGETIKVVTLDKTSAEYKDLEKKFLVSVKNGIYNTGNAPNPANNPVGQFNNIQVNKVNSV